MEVRVLKRKIHKSINRVGNSNYPQYKITIPREFVEEYGKEVYLIVDGIGLLVPNEETLMKILTKIPEIRELLMQKTEKVE